MSSFTSASRVAAASARPDRWNAGIRWCGAIALVVAAAYAGYQIALHAALGRIQEAATHRLDMMSTNLEAELSRFDYLPALLEMTPVVPALLEAPGDPQLRQAVNRYLDGVNATAGAEMLYVLDRNGTSLAASDWDQPGTTVGQDLSFRPYVIEARNQGRGRFYGVGITSKKPGYYLSYTLRHSDQQRGIAVVKVNIDDAEQAWRKLPGDVALFDDRGVVILSTRDDLKFRPVAPLDALMQDEVMHSRPYGQAELLPLRWIARESFTADSQIVAVDDVDHLATTRKLQRAPWQLVVLDPVAPALTVARFASLTASLAMAVLLLLAVTLAQRRRALRQELETRAALQAAHDNLESTVIARTAELRAAQNELVHAGKMAALGQMSAGMAHELNQPLTALRTLSESAGILLDQRRPEEVHGNLRRIAAMVDRLARLTAQLKTFAHKNDLPAVPVSLSRSLHDAQAMVNEAARAQAVQVEISVQPAGLCVLGDEAALGSVFVNLMRNAIEAMRDMPHGTLRIEATASNGHARVRFCDTGPGIRDDILPRLFEPFVTSKPAGAGLGLGLVISAQLVRAQGGTLRASNTAQGGACFECVLPCHPSDDPPMAPVQESTVK